MLRLQVGSPLIDIVFCRRGRFLLIDAEDGLHLWELPDGKEVLHIPMLASRSSPSPLALTPDDCLLIHGHHVLDLDLLWNNAEGGPAGGWGLAWAMAPKGPFCVKGAAGLEFEPGTNLAFSGNGKLLAALGLRGLEVWDVPHRRCLRRDPVAGDILAMAPDGHTLTVGALDSKEVRIRDTRHVREITRLEHSNTIHRLAFSPDGRRLASMTRHPSRTFLWDTAAWQCIGEFKAFRGRGAALEFNADGSLLAAASEEGVIHIWNVDDRREVEAMDWEIGLVRRIAFSPDGMTAAAAGSERTVAVWDIDDE